MSRFDTLQDHEFRRDEWDAQERSELITVCDKCLQASCWQGVFYCDDYKTAGTVQKTRRELLELNREHPSYWKTDKEISDNPRYRIG
jgi:hypothetical protein